MVLMSFEQKLTEFVKSTNKDNLVFYYLPYNLNILQINKTFTI